MSCIETLVQRNEFLLKYLDPEDSEERRNRRKQTMIDFAAYLEAAGESVTKMRKTLDRL